MTESLAVVGKIRQRIIDLADQKILAIIQTGDDLGLRSYAYYLTGFSPARQSLSFSGLPICPLWRNKAINAESDDASEWNEYFGKKQRL